MDKLDYLYKLLCIEEKLRVQAGFVNIKTHIAGLLREFNVEIAEEVSSRVFPSDIGVTETDTQLRRV